MEEGALRPKPKVLFEVGEAIKVVDGPFQDFNGTVEEVKPEKGKVRVLISIFGRATPVELDFVQVEKAWSAGDGNCRGIFISSRASGTRG